MSSKKLHLQLIYVKMVNDSHRLAKERAMPFLTAYNTPSKARRKLLGLTPHFPHFNRENVFNGQPVVRNIIWPGVEKRRRGGKEEQ